MLAWSLLHFLMPKKNLADEKRFKQEQLDRQYELQRSSREKLEREKKLEAEKTRLAEELRLKMLAEERRNTIAQQLSQFHAAVATSEWEDAEKSVGVLQDVEYDLTEVAKLTDLLDQKRAEQRQRLIKVSELLGKARALDNGKYSKEAIGYLDEALQMMPDHPEVKELRNKIDAYTATVKVPEDFASLSDALVELRAGDTILLAKGIYKTPTVISKAVIIKGAGVGETVIECDTRTAPALFFSGGEKVYKVSDLSVKGVNYNDNQEERFPLVAVEANVLLERVKVENSASHGIAVTSGILTMKDSTVTACAWDGVSVKGLESKLIIEDCKIIENYEHGIDFWEGASGKVLRTEVKNCAGSGIVVMGKGANVVLEQVQIYGNQQSGILVNSEAVAKLKKVFVSKNVLSGVVIQGKGTKVECGILVSNRNGEAGYFIDPAATVEGFENVTAEKNKKGKLVRKAFVELGAE